MVCSKLETIESCQAVSHKRISGIYTREVSYLSVYQDFKKTPHLNSNDRLKIAGFGRYGEKLFSSIQGIIINYFFESALVESGKLALNDSAIDKRWGTALIGAMKLAFNVSGKVVPSCGILSGVGFLFGLVHGKMKKSDREKTRQKYGRVNQLGDGNLLKQMRVAKLTTLAFLDNLSKNRLMPDSDQNFEKTKKLFRKYYELAIFELSLDGGNFSTHNLHDSIGKKVGQSIENHKEPSKLKSIFEKIPVKIKATLEKSGSLRGYKIEKMARKIEGYLAKNNE